MSTFNAVCSELGIDVVNPTQSDLDKLINYCHVEVSQDRMFEGNLSQQMKECSDLIQFYLERFLPHVNDDDVCSPVAVFNEMSSLECMARNGLDRYLSHCHATSAQINTLFGLMSPLHMTATYGYQYTTLALLALGAKATTVNARDELPIHYALPLPGLYDEALVRAKEDTFITLYDTAPETLSVPMEDGATVFHTMACYGYADLLSAFLSKSPSLALTANNFGKLPIHTAILNGQLETTRVLLGAGKLKEMIDFEDRNPVHYAAAFSTPKMLALCLSAVDNPLKTKDNSGKTPLMLAAYYGNLANVEVLLDAGSNPLFEKDNNGKNALQIALNEKQIEVVERLLQVPGSKASLNEEDHQALRLLYSNGHNTSI